MATENDNSGLSSPTVKSLAKEMEEMREAIGSQGAMNKQLLEIQEENVSLKESIRKQALEIQAIRAQGITADQRIENARMVIDELRRERMLGGRNKFIVKNSRFKDRRGDPAQHEFYTNATSPQDAVADFKRRAGVTWDSTEGNDPISAELADIVGETSVTK